MHIGLEMAKLEDSHVHYVFSYCISCKCHNMSVTEIGKGLEEVVGIIFWTRVISY